MIVAVISACHLQDPQSCHQFRMQLADDVDTRTCVTRLIPMLPQWSQEHPGWRIEKWTCDNGRVADL